MTRTAARLLLLGLCLLLPGLAVPAGCPSADDDVADDDDTADDDTADDDTADDDTADDDASDDDTADDDTADDDTGDDDTTPPGALVWSFDAGDLDAKTYAAYVATMPVSAEGYPQPDSNSYRLALPTKPQYYHFGINYHVPELLPDGRPRAWLPEVPHNAHNMFRMQNNDVFPGGIYTVMQQPYKYEFEADFSAASDWASITWCVFFQLWGAAYPGSWTTGGHPRNPPIALSLDGAEFEVRVYGEHTTDLDSVATNTTWTHSDSANWPFTPGPHLFEVWITSDYRQPKDGGVGYVRVDMDGATVYENASVVNAIASQIDKTDAGGAHMLGAYTYTWLPEPTYADIAFDRVRIYELP